MRTQEKASLGLPAQMYTMAIVQRQIFSRSNIDFFIVDKQSLGLGAYQSGKYYHKDLVKMVGQDTLLNTYNRVFGFDFNLITKSNRWNGDFYYHQSLDAFHTDKNYSAGTFISYNTRNLTILFGNNLVGKNYVAETGYVPKLEVYPGYLSNFGRVQGIFYPTKNKIATMGQGFEVNQTIIPDGTLTDRTYSLDYFIHFLNTASFNVAATRIFQKLPENFNPIYPRGDSTYLAGQQFQWTEFNMRYSSNARKIVNYSFQGSGGQYYTGHRQRYGGTINYRYQSYGSLSVTVDYNNLQLENPMVVQSFY